MGESNKAIRRGFGSISKSVLFIGAGFAALASAPSAQAALIDNFNTTQFVTTNPATTGPEVVNNGVATMANSIGGNRSITVRRARNTGAMIADVNGMAPGIARFSNQTTDGADFAVLYDGGTDSTVSPSGLMGVNLTTGGVDRFRVWVRATTAITLAIDVHSGGVNSSRATFVSPSGGLMAAFTPIEVLFTSFVPTGAMGGANFAAVGAIRLFVPNPPGPFANPNEIQFDLFETSAPTGACCVASSPDVGCACRIVTEADCGFAGGTYYGDDRVCIGNVNDPPVIGMTAPIDDCYDTLADAEADARAAVRAAGTTDTCPRDLDFSVSSDVNDCVADIEVTAEDNCGQTDTATFETTIDPNAPTARCAGPEERVAVDEDCQAEFTFRGRVTDDCCVDVSSIMVTATIQSGMALVTVGDCTTTIPPMEDPTSPMIVDVACTVGVARISECPVEVLLSLTASDCCGHPMAAACTDTVFVVDRIDPVITHCPDPITLERGDKICNSAVQDWLDTFRATDNCGRPALTNDAPECGFPAGETTEVTFTATDVCGNTSECVSRITIEPEPRVTFDQKGSLLIFSKVEIKWDGTGNLTQDTFLDVTNDYPAGVTVQAYFINGDTELEETEDENGEVVQNFEPGWNTADCRFALTANQPHFWSAAQGSDKCQAFSVIDADGPGRPDADNHGASRILRGYVVMWAVTFNAEKNLWEEIRWNHLKGDAVIVNYEKGTAWEYNAWSTQARCGAHGEPLLDCTRFDDNGVCCDAEVIPGNLDLDGFQYDVAFGTLLLDFYGTGSTALSGGNQRVMVDTDLTVHAVSADLRQDGCGPVLTKIEAEIWNEFETKFSGTRRCICCWDQTMLSDWVRSEAIPNHFKRSALRTDKGKARLDGVYSTECDYKDLCGEVAFDKMWSCGQDDMAPEYSGFSQNASILGLATKFITFSGHKELEHATAGLNLVGAGREPGTIQSDVMYGSEELQGGSVRPISEPSPAPGRGVSGGKRGATGR